VTISLLSIFTHILQCHTVLLNVANVIVVVII
jgi:hypothetical protein